MGRAWLQDLQPSGEGGHKAMFLQSLGKDDSAPKAIVMLNAAAALVVAGVAPDLRAGVVTSRRVINSGAALEKLRQLAELSQRLG